MKREYDFDPDVNELAKEQSGYCCANITCRTPILQKHLHKAQKPSGFGQVAHIYSASENKNLRQLPKTINKIFLRSIENALLLCTNCHNDIDYDGYHEKYTVELLLTYKEEIEYIVKKYLSKLKKTYKELSAEEVLELHKIITSSKRENFKIEGLTHDEILKKNIIQAIYRLDVEFTDEELQYIEKCESFEVDISRINFGMLDKKTKDLFKGKIITINPFDEFDILIKAKNNKQFNMIITKCRYTTLGVLHKYTRSLFDENHDFFNICVITYIVNTDNLTANIDINFNLESLKTKQINLNNYKLLDELKSLIEIMVKDKIILSSKKGNDAWSVIHDYDEAVMNKSNLIQHVDFLTIMQHVARTQNININIDQNIYDSNKAIIFDIDFFYNLIVNEKISNFFLLNRYFLKNIQIHLLPEDDISYVLRNILSNGNINEDLYIIMAYIYSKINIKKAMCKNFTFEVMVNDITITIQIENIILFFIEEFFYCIKTNNSKMAINFKR